MTATKAPSTYVTPECREARNLSWEAGHRHCPGPLDVRQRRGSVPLEVLKCACHCHNLTH
ncbi:hypothetical protein [Streptomyces violascens]|uniref:Uncharacterized protein n=1 Tax=Streptomyces violascens TaxID=67381 RepID=A0ABQ3QXG3_9ACTN|nr:hypothetical protein [Streptomyces violascens]GGU13438.1 hypothetical protein GCM10010289_38920 [Streptomyces violascens]GHI41942.1 hypothetical protein Sviol_63500 [Streptomyces violascens]